MFSFSCDLMLANVPGASFGGVFRPVSLSPVTKVKDKKNCQNTTKTPA